MLAILFPHLYEDVDEEMGITGTADADGIDDASRMLIDEDVARRLRVDAAIATGWDGTIWTICAPRLVYGISCVFSRGGSESGAGLRALSSCGLAVSCPAVDLSQHSGATVCAYNW
jgi:hypothetical protein